MKLRKKGNKRIVIVGKQYNKDKTHGPTAVMFSLEEAFAKLHVPYDTITLNETCAKFRYFLRLFRILFYRGRIINVHINGVIPAAIVCLISKLNKKCDYYLTVHGVYREQIKYYDAGRFKKIYCFLEKKVYNSFPNLICVSDLCKNKILELYNPKGNVYVIENAVELMDVELQNKEKVGKEFLFLGGTKPVKGTEQLLKVFDKLIEMDSEIHLNIYGRTTNDELELLRKNIKQIGRNDSICYKGYINSKQELLEICNENDFHIALSRFDTFNVSIVEAMDYGCVNITNRNSGASSIINHGHNGFLIDDDIKNPATTAKSILCIVQGLSVDQYNNIRINAHERIKKNSWENVAKRYLRLFRGGKNEGISH